jgi:hypothetical protein
MEFGTCPLPLGREETVRRGPLFETPHQCVLSAGESREARYLAALFEIPEGVESIAGADTVDDLIVIHDHQGTPAISVKAAGCESYLSPK